MLIKPGSLNLKVLLRKFVTSSRHVSQSTDQVRVLTHHDPWDRHSFFQQVEEDGLCCGIFYFFSILRQYIWEASSYLTCNSYTCYFWLLGNQVTLDQEVQRLTQTGKRSGEYIGRFCDSTYQKLRSHSLMRQPTVRLLHISCVEICWN